MEQNSIFNQNIQTKLSLDENNQCCDCSSQHVTHVNLKFGVLICSFCAEVHKYLPEMSDQVKLIEKVPWTEEDIEQLPGNIENEYLEKYLPLYIHKPIQDMKDTAYREIFITAKYEHQLFASLDKQSSYPITSGIKNGNILFIEDSDRVTDVRWYPHTFELAKDTLSIFETKNGKTKCIQMIPLAKLKVKIEEKENEVTKILALFHFEDNGCPKTHYYFTRPKETIEWYYAIRAGQKNIKTRRETFIQAFALKNDLKMSGYLYKTGASFNDKWRRRWVVFRDSTVHYYKSSSSKHAQGSIYLCDNTKIVRVPTGPLHFGHASPTPHTFFILTPIRTYRFCADSLDEQNEWIEFIDNIVYLKHKNDNQNKTTVLM